MKYNEDLFSTSYEYYAKTDIENTDVINEEILCLEKELLQILLKKFKNNLEDKNKNYNGVLKIRFKSSSLGKTDNGYSQIKKLIELGCFDSFFNQYCLYLGSTEYSEDKNNDSYYEIIWDYRTYFEMLSMHEINRGLSTKDTTYEKNSMINAISTFREMPLKHQLAIIKSFIQKVKRQSEVQKREEIEEQCINKGHNYSDWKVISYTTREKNPYFGLRDYIVSEGYEYIDVLHTKWERTCARCGFVETVKEEPQELIDKRKEQEKNARIKELKKELYRLENE